MEFIRRREIYDPKPSMASVSRAPENSFTTTIKLFKYNALLMGTLRLPLADHPSQCSNEYANAACVIVASRIPGRMPSASSRMYAMRTHDSVSLGPSSFVTVAVMYHEARTMTETDDLDIPENMNSFCQLPSLSFSFSRPALPWTLTPLISPGSY